MRAWLLSLLILAGTRLDLNWYQFDRECLINSTINPVVTVVKADLACWETEEFEIKTHCRPCSKADKAEVCQKSGFIESIQARVNFCYWFEQSIIEREKEKSQFKSAIVEKVRSDPVVSCPSTKVNCFGDSSVWSCWLAPEPHISPLNGCVNSIMNTTSGSRNNWARYKKWNSMQSSPPATLNSYSYTNAVQSRPLLWQILPLSTCSIILLPLAHRHLPMWLLLTPSSPFYTAMSTSFSVMRPRPRPSFSVTRSKSSLPPRLNQSHETPLTSR